MVKNTVLLFAGSEDLADQDVALISHEGQNLLDWYIQQLRRQGRTVHVVLGANGDNLLSSCRSLLHIDFIFDPNWQAGLVAHVKAALAADHAPTMILAPTAALPDVSLLSQFEYLAEAHENTARGSTDVYVLNHESNQNSMPWIVTRSGHDKILKMELTGDLLQELSIVTFSQLKSSGTSESLSI